ncbi:protein FAM117B-like [Culicoides brevitarsis]|uniref:protein FAM117B-like n=1 Tax=Culicoides brevitarsis TaxID=469753 RepID=UPI00307C2B57
MSSGARVKTKPSPMKAFQALPIIGSGNNAATNLLPIHFASITQISSSFSPLTRHISPEHAGGPIAYKGKVISQSENCMRRTASLDQLTTVKATTKPPNPCIFWQLDKATQTDESCLSDHRPGAFESPSEKMEKVIKHRIPRQSYRSACEHSVSIQTLSPVHVKASPVLIPSRNQPIHMRPMRSSVEGLNQEIEKLVLHPGAGPMHSCRQELEMFSRGTPEGHRAPITDLWREHSRSTQTPLLSPDSQSTSPSDEGAQSKDASPRINRFLAREPPDGCEKVNLNLKQIEGSSDSMSSFKPVGFELRPSLGSAFQPIPIIPKVVKAELPVNLEEDVTEDY